MSGYARTQDDRVTDERLSCDVELRLRGTPEWLSVARSVVTDMAIRADFDLDDVDDLKIAVDEGCSQLIRLLGPVADTGEPVLRCRLRLRGEELEIRLIMPGETEPELRGSFGWHVLTVVTDEVWLERVALGDDGIGGICLGMRKRRAGAERSGVPATER